MWVCFYENTQYKNNLKAAVLFPRFARGFFENLCLLISAGLTWGRLDLAQPIYSFHNTESRKAIISDTCSYGGEQEWEGRAETHNTFTLGPEVILYHFDSQSICQTNHMRRV